MEEASSSLVHRRYFDAERRCVDALRMAFANHDYERMARIVLPLEEARRQKRDMAFDARRVMLVDGEIPTGRKLVPGCYLVCPPRVGLDGKLLREEADRKKVPTIVVTREPTTREGLWPVVSLGPVTVRLKVPPPVDLHGASRAEEAAGSPESGTGTKGVKRARKSTKRDLTTNASGAHISMPPPEWFLHACEALGDAAIASVDPELDPLLRVDAVLKRLEAHPDHEKLHQALGEACRDAIVETTRLSQLKKSGVTTPREDAPEDMDDFDL